MMDNIAMEDLLFAEIIKKERKEHKMTQEDLATFSGVSIATIRGIEQGTVSPNVSTLNKILKLFNLELCAIKRINKEE